MKESRASFLYILNILLIASAALLLALVLLLYIPAILKIKSERKDVLTIFLSVPKSAISNICDSLLENDETKEIEDEAIQDEIGDTTVFLDPETSSVPVLRKLNIRSGGSLGMKLVCLLLLIFVAFIFALVVTMFLICVFFLQKSINDAPAILMAGTRVSSVSRLRYLSTELILNDKVKWKTRDSIRVIVKFVTKSHV